MEDGLIPKYRELQLFSWENIFVHMRAFILVADRNTLIIYCEFINRCLLFGPFPQNPFVYLLTHLYFGAAGYNY